MSRCTFGHQDGFAPAVLHISLVKQNTEHACDSIALHEGNDDLIPDGMQEDVPLIHFYLIVIGLLYMAHPCRG